jgi:hypothetical protein
MEATGEDLPASDWARLLHPRVRALVLLESAKFIDEHLADMCGTSNEYSISDIFIRELVEAFRDALPGTDNPLSTQKWAELIHDGNAPDGALF